MNACPPLLDRLAAALVALALSVLGFGHAVAPAGSTDPTVAAWVQAGGSLDDLCLSGTGRSGNGQHADCPVCALAKSAAPAAIALVPLPDACLVAVRLPRPVAHLADAHAPRAPPARGPPLALA